MSNKEQLQANNLTLQQIEEFMLNQGASLVTLLNSHINNKNNPHDITPAQIGAAPANVVNGNVE
jgi:hypothetical protein